MLHFEFVPDLPEKLGVFLGVAELAYVFVNCSASIDFTQPSF